MKQKSEGLNGGLDPWGVGSANSGRPIFALNLQENVCFKGIWEKLGAKLGRPKFADPTPHLKPSEKRFFWGVGGGNSEVNPQLYQKFRKGVGGQRGWREEALHMPEMQRMLRYLSSTIQDKQEVSQRGCLGGRFGYFLFILFGGGGGGVPREGGSFLKNEPPRRGRGEGFSKERGRGVEGPVVCLRGLGGGFFFALFFFHQVVEGHPRSL